jgi:hypothetical protein
MLNTIRKKNVEKRISQVQGLVGYYQTSGKIGWIDCRYPGYFIRFLDIDQHDSLSLDDQSSGSGSGVKSLQIK